MPHLLRHIEAEHGFKFILILALPHTQNANPYLFTAATLACGLLGIREKLEPTEPVESNAYYLNLPPVFPRDLGAALVELQNCQPIIDLIGKDFIDSFVSIKQMEIDHFQAEISLWEQRYLCESL